MVGLSDMGLYQRTLLVFHARWENCTPGQWTEAPAAQTPPLATIAIDLSNKVWVARGQNWKLVRDSFMHAVSGTAEKQQANILLWGKSSEPVVVNQYFKDDKPRRSGPAYRGTHPQNPATWAQRTFYWRYDDPSIMTPMDRMSEMLDRAVRSRKLRNTVHDQLGGLISPEALLPLAGTFVALFGAEFVGGAAAAMFVARLLGVNQLACDYYFYQPRGARLHHICMAAATPRDLDDGAEILAEILAQMITDLAMALGLHAMAKVASRMFNALMSIAPERVQAMLKEGAAKAHGFIRSNGYARRDLLHDAAGTPLEAAAKHMYERSCERHREILVVREPDSARGVWIQASHIMNNAKPTWLKARSADGWHGLVCLKKADVHASLKPAGRFEMGNLRGASHEIDAAIGENRRPQMFDMPMDEGALKDFSDGGGIDHHYVGHKKINLQGHKLVDLGDRYMVVDGLGRPYVSDLDLATRQRPGMEKAGQHLPATPNHAVEDNYVLEYEMNRDYHAAAGAHVTHAPAQHGGGGATVVYTRTAQNAGKVAGKDYWTPKDNHGVFKKERLIVFLPEWNGVSVKAKMYVLPSWEAFRDFASANHLEFPF